MATIENFSWVIEDRLAGMAHPGADARAFAELKELGIGAVVTLTERPVPRELPEQFGMAYLHLPVRNFQPPTLDQMRAFVRFTDENLAADRPVAAHCLAGIGRTGTMLACYLVWRGLSAPQAIRAVRSVRWGSIETPEQEDAVYLFAADAERAEGAPQ